MKVSLFVLTVFLLLAVCPATSVRGRLRSRVREGLKNECVEKVAAIVRAPEEFPLYSVFTDRNEADLRKITGQEEEEEGMIKPTKEELLNNAALMTLLAVKAAVDSEEFRHWSTDTNIITWSGYKPINQITAYKPEPIFEHTQCDKPDLRLLETPPKEHKLYTINEHNRAEMIFRRTCEQTNTLGEKMPKLDDTNIPFVCSEDKLMFKHFGKSSANVYSLSRPCKTSQVACSTFKGTCYYIKDVHVPATAGQYSQSQLRYLLTSKPTKPSVNFGKCGDEDEKNTALLLAMTARMLEELPQQMTVAIKNGELQQLTKQIKKLPVGEQKTALEQKKVQLESKITKYFDLEAKKLTTKENGRYEKVKGVTWTETDGKRLAHLKQALNLDEREDKELATLTHQEKEFQEKQALEIKKQAFTRDDQQQMETIETEFQRNGENPRAMFFSRLRKRVQSLKWSPTSESEDRRLWAETQHFFTSNDLIDFLKKNK